MLWKYKKAYQETNEDVPLLPLYSFCYEGFWECLDEVHDCPGLCGFVTYLDEIGIEHTQSGICIDDGIITIEASSIVQTSGVSLVDCYNFDVTADWENIIDYPVIDETSFTDFLENYIDDEGNDLTNISIYNFSIDNGRLRCNLNADGTILDLGGIGITEILKIGDIDGLTILNLDGNNIEDFNMSVALPSTLNRLDLDVNQIENFNPSIPLPVNLTILNLNSNQMTTAGYIASETWANTQPSFTSTCTINLQSNIDSVLGTNLETILISKNCLVTA